MKTCIKCKETKPYTEFFKNKSRKDGHRFDCKACVKAYNQQNKEHISKSYKKWFAANKERKAASNKAWYEANADKVAIRIKAWREANPERCTATSSKQDALKRGAVIPSDFDFEATIPFYAEARRLTRETGIPHEVDHIIPCRKGGLHCASNLQVLTQAENLEKG